MATKLTQAMRDAIASLKAAGASNNAISKALKAKFGSGPDRRNIDRYVAKIESQGAPAAPRTLGRAVPTTGRAPKKARSDIATLEKLEAHLSALIFGGKVTPSEVAKLSAELRQVQAAVRQAKEWSAAPAAQSRKVQEDADAVIEQLRKLAKTNEPASDPEPEAAADDEPVSGTAACG